MSELMTIVISFHHMRVRDFKTYYLAYILGHLQGEFPQAVSYQHSVELMPSTLGPLCAYFQICLGLLPSTEQAIHLSGWATATHGCYPELTLTKAACLH